MKTITEKKPLDKELIDKFIDEGMLCKDIGANFGYYSTHFYPKVKKFLGEYLSVYASKRRKKSG